MEVFLFIFAPAIIGGLTGLTGAIAYKRLLPEHHAEPAFHPLNAHWRGPRI